jgi:hypothetical protein
MLAQRMITTYFKWSQSLTRLLSTPAGPYLSSLAQDLAALGFSSWILRARLQGAAHFSHWNRHQGKSLEQLHESLLEEFAAHLGKCRCRRPPRLSIYHNVRVLAGARALVEHLRDRAVVTSAPPAEVIAVVPTLLSGFCDWMRTQRGRRKRH